MVRILNNRGTVSVTQVHQLLEMKIVFKLNLPVIVRHRPLEPGPNANSCSMLIMNSYTMIESFSACCQALCHPLRHRNAATWIMLMSKRIPSCRIIEPVAIGPRMTFRSSYQFLSFVAGARKSFAIQILNFLSHSQLRHSENRQKTC